MKGYYLFAPVEKENIGPQSGVERKVRAQHKALCEHFDCELVILDPVEYTGSIKEKIVRRLPFTAAWRKWKYNGEFDDADFLYIRQVYHDDSFVRYLKAIKKNNPGIKIIYEVPTYPYDPQTRISAINLIFVIKDRICRHKAAKCFDAIVTFFGQDDIWGVKCIKTINGYDFSGSVLPERSYQKKINIVFVAATASWHGYDRMIKGLADYYSKGGNKEEICFHMIGKVLPEHRKLVDKYNLNDHVIFYGYLPADKVSEVYANCLIAVNVIGECKGESPTSSSLKSREYGAYGLPFISSLPVDYVPIDYKYQLLVPRDDSPIDIKTVVGFFKSIYGDKDCNTVAHEIREYAYSRCDMSVTIKPICEWISKHEGKESL